MSNTWKKLLTFRGKRHVEHEVGGQELNFYPNKMALLEQARDLSGPVAKAINTLMTDTSRDSKSMVKRLSGTDPDGAIDADEPEILEMQEITTDAISTQMAEFRLNQRNEAIETLLTTIADQRNRILLGAMFMDSLRDLFPYHQNRPTSEIEEFLYGDGEEYEGLDIPQLCDMLVGWMKANSKTFGSMGEKVVEFMQKRMGDLAPSEDRSEEGDVKTTSGETSKTPTLLQSDGDSEPTSSTD